MSFITWQYLLFLPLVLLLYWQLPGKWRLVLLLAASYFFYACWDVRFLALVPATPGIDFVCALSGEGKKTGTAQVLLLALLPSAWLSGCSLFLPASGINILMVATAAALGMAFFAGHELIWGGARENRRRWFLILSIGFF